MEYKDFVISMGYLGLAFGKEFTNEETMQYYDFLKEYNDTTLTTAIKNLIKTSKFMPKITELIEACENAKQVVKFDVIEYMNRMGYFKSPKEYDKATQFMIEGIVPTWLQNDINKYYKEMINNMIEYKEQVLIG